MQTYDYAYLYPQINTYLYMYLDMFLPPMSMSMNPVVLHDSFYPPAQGHSQAGLSKITEGVQLHFSCCSWPSHLVLGLTEMEIEGMLRL